MALNNLNWDDLRIFITVADKTSIRAAAREHRIAVNTARARMERLERMVGETLFVRGRKGVRLTREGVALRSVAGRLRGAAVSGGVENSAYCAKPDELVIGTTEGLGSFWLTPRLLDLQRRFPSTTISMLCDNDVASDRSDEVDVGIAWKYPKNPDLIVSKLATLHYMAFASREYIRQHGVPEQPSDLLQHRFIEQSAPGVKSELLDLLVGTERPPGFLPLKTNASLAIFWAVSNGVGIAFMPTYAAALVPRLVPIDLPFQIKFDVWYYYHPEGRNCSLVAECKAWLKEIFSPDTNPWFRSDFVHPRDFRLNEPGNVVPLFQGLAAGLE
jgi:DNA-binding transcriptional LysR family regulator